MISEEGLRAAASAADQAILCSLPTANECEHEFSKAFEKKMQRISRRAKHPILYRLPKQVACAFLIAVLADTSWLTFDVEARAAFFAWVKAQYEFFVEYRFEGDAPQDVTTYELTWLPDGFELVKQQTLDKGGRVRDFCHLYRNPKHGHFRPSETNPAGVVCQQLPQVRLRRHPCDAPRAEV